MRVIFIHVQVVLNKSLPSSFGAVMSCFDLSIACTLREISLSTYYEYWSASGLADQSLGLVSWTS